ncbi:hypothetical protein U1Q18_030723 [Sarracenia purpurea var. burkii]
MAAKIKTPAKNLGLQAKKTTGTTSAFSLAAISGATVTSAPSATRSGLRCTSPEISEVFYHSARSEISVQFDKGSPSPVQPAISGDFICARCLLEGLGLRRKSWPAANPTQRIRIPEAIREIWILDLDFRVIIRCGR